MTKDTPVKSHALAKEPVDWLNPGLEKKVGETRCGIRVFRGLLMPDKKIIWKRLPSHTEIAITTIVQYPTCRNCARLTAATPDDKVRGESKETGDMKTKKPKPLTLDELVEIVESSPYNKLANGASVRRIGVDDQGVIVDTKLDFQMIVDKLNERMGLT